MRFNKIKLINKSINSIITAVTFTLISFSLLFSNSADAACSANLNMDGNKIIHLKNPTDTTDGASKGYVDTKMAIVATGSIPIPATQVRNNHFINYGCGRTGLLMAQMDTIANGVWSSIAVVSSSKNSNVTDDIISENRYKYQFIADAINAWIMPAPNNHQNSNLPGFSGNEACGHARVVVDRADTATTLYWRFIGTPM